LAFFCLTFLIFIVNIYSWFKKINPQQIKGDIKVRIKQEKRNLVTTKIMIIIFLLLFFCSLLVPISNERQPVNSAKTRLISYENIDESERVLRQEIANRWLSNFNLVVEKTKDPEAMAVRSFVFSNCNLGLPKQDSLQVIKMDGWEKEGFFSLVCLIEADKKKGEVWSLYYNDFQGAAAFVDRPDWPKMILLRDDIPFSPVWAGLSLLHEARHAQYHFEAEKRQTALMPMAVEERLVHQFIHRQLNWLGGMPYAQLIQTEADFLETEMRKNSLTPGQQWTLPGKDPGLDQIWSKALSNLEYHMRLNTFWIQVNYLLVDRYHQGDKNKAKEQIIVNLYLSDSEQFDPRGVP